MEDLKFCDVMTSEVLQCRFVFIFWNNVTMEEVLQCCSDYASVVMLQQLFRGAQ